MKCFNCGRLKMRTIYPTYSSDGITWEKYVQKVCNTCGHKSSPVKIPEPIKRC